MKSRVEEGFTTRLPDPVDQAAAIEEERLNRLLQDRETARKAEEDRAKDRLTDDAGNALCEDCGAIIPSKRLEILPNTLFCVGCQSANEFLDKRFI